MLVYHPYAYADSVLWGADLHGFAIDSDFAGIRTIKTIKNIHQCSFACIHFPKRPWILLAEQQD